MEIKKKERKKVQKAIGPSSAHARPCAGQRWPDGLCALGTLLTTGTNINQSCHSFGTLFHAGLRLRLVARFASQPVSRSPGVYALVDLLLLLLVLGHTPQDYDFATFAVQDLKPTTRSSTVPGNFKPALFRTLVAAGQANTGKTPLKIIQWNCRAISRNIHYLNYLNNYLNEVRPHIICLQFLLSIKSKLPHLQGYHFPPITEANKTPVDKIHTATYIQIGGCRWRGMIRVFLLSRAALPANSNTSAARYSRTAARYTGAPAPTRSA